MITPIKISAKNLGYTALADFCPRCYWLRLRTSHKLPFQTFPGIFSSIDAYTKHCVHAIIDRRYGADDILFLPSWMQEIGNVTSYEPIPHWSKNLFTDTKSNIILSGIPDDIWVRADGTKAIVDFKTAKKTNNQDVLYPMYEIQNNVYDVLFGYHADLYLIYMEPLTEKSAASCNIIDVGFNMGFNAVVVPVVNDRKVVRQALTITRDIYELEKPPESRSGCKDCQMLENVIELLK
jgi:hypothetical protein